MDNNTNPLKVAVHGLDERSCKMMAMFLQGPCHGVAVVVNESSAECEIFDADSVSGKKLLDDYLQKEIQKPIVILSLNTPHVPSAFHVKKPVKIEEMVDALQKAKKSLGSIAATTNNSPSNTTDTILSEAHDANEHRLTDNPKLKLFVKTSEQKKTSKHRAAMQLDEKGFVGFIGNVPGLDVNDPRQFSKAHYNPKEYFQGYVDSAYKVSRAKGHIRQLNSGWSPLIIFPQSDEIWLDADESQIRAFSGLTISNTLGAKMSITPLNLESATMERSLERYQSMDAFLWKVACWASKGRYPESIDINQPVFLKQWPNFTRLLLMPHAMRIAALLIQGPRTLLNVSQVLNVKPQYVFVFISAASALGLVGQSRRGVDTLVEPDEIKSNKNQSLLSRILSVLRGKKA